MGEIVWGPEIPVDGVRPAWLANDVMVLGLLSNYQRDHSHAWQIGKSKWRDFARLSAIKLPADHPHYRPADTVTIARMTEAEAQSNKALEAAFELHKIPNASWIAGWMAAHRVHGLIREETLTERFTRETGHAVTPAVEAALTWGRGE